MGSGILFGQETKIINKVEAQTLQSAYKNGVIDNAKDINTGSSKGESNRPCLVNSKSTNIPDGLSWGIREVFFYSNSNIVIQITGVDTDSNPKVWYCIGNMVNSVFTIGQWQVVSGGNDTPTTPGTSTDLGLTKLYDEVGSNIDGTMTQDAITTALKGKASSTHTHKVNDIADFPTSMPASDVSDWAKADKKPTYSKSEVGLGNVGNFKAVSTEPNQTLSDVEKENARTNIGAGTSSFSGDYNDLSNKPSIPTVGNGTITITQNGETKGTFTLNQGGNTTVDLADTDNNTTYSVGTTSYSGTTKLYTGTGTATDGTMTQAALTTALSGKAESSHTHDDRYYTETEMDAKLDEKANSKHTHASGDITSLDASKLTGTIDIARLPQGALDRLVKVADDTARFKLTTADIQLGDTVKVTSTGKMYYVIDESKLSSADGYEPYTADSATSVPWSGVTGKPTTFTPATHTHTKSQITDFPASLPANGGNSSTVNGHTVNSDVPANAKFTDTNTWRPVETTLSGVDLNTIVTPGFYNAGGSNNCTNKPSGVDHFGMIVIHRASGSYYTQIVFNDTSSWRRFCVSGTWGNWIEEKLTDTKYSTGTASALGLTKLYTGVGTATDGTMTQSALNTQFNKYLLTANVKNYMAAFQTSQPASSSTANFWVDTSDASTSNNQINIPQINDSTNNAVDTWSSNKIKSEFYKTGGCMVFGGKADTSTHITDTSQHYVPIVRSLSNQNDADDYMSYTSDGAILLKPGTYIVSGKIQISDVDAPVSLFSTWKTSTDNKTYNVTYETQVSENYTYIANTIDTLNAKLSLNTMTINITANTYLKAVIQAINKTDVLVADSECRFQVTKIR